jgi:hypothetical protein
LAQYTTTIYIDQSAYNSYDFPHSVFKDSILIASIKNKAGLGWNLDAVPGNKRIVNVKLYFYVSNAVGNEANYRNISGIWEDDFTWYNYSYTNGEYLSISPGWNEVDLGATTNKAFVVWGISGVLENIFNIHSHRASNKPYIVVTYEDIPPDPPSSLYPNNTTVNARNVIRFSWTHRSREGLQQKGFTLEYSTDGGDTWTTVTQTTSNQYYELPAETLPLTAEILWRVKTVDGNDLESSFANAKFNTAIIPQKAPILISPLSGYLDGSKSITFKWSFVGGTAEDKQAKYDLEYSLDQGSTWTKITVESEAQEHTVPANTFQSGNVYWRVKTYNTYDDESPYSEIASFFVINSPPMPQIINVTNSAKPTITWNSVEQQIYEIQILKNDEIIFETGKIPSPGNRSYKIEVFLDDDEYLARLRVTNVFDLSSPWAEYMFTISTTKPEKPNIEVFSGEYCIIIRTEESSLKKLVYRNNKFIGEMQEEYFEDYTGENKKEYQYFIRVVDENDNFNDSDIKIGKCRFRDNTLALANKPNEFIKLRYGFNSELKKSTTIGNIGSLMYFDGREYPVVEFAEFNEYTRSLSFFVKSKEELDKFIGLVSKKQTLSYRDSEGENIYGTILNVEYQKNIFGYEVNCTITKTSDVYD